MKVLMVHNRYAQAGGEDTAFEQDTQLLRDRGHEVRTLERANTEIEVGSLRAKGRLLARTTWSRAVYAETRRTIQALGPDILHVHNFLPLISPSIYYAAWAEGVPVVQSLHNYRLICPAATLYREGRVCEDCVGRPPLPGVLHGCYRGSRGATFAVASMLQVHRILKTWQRVEAYIAVSGFLKHQLVRGGLPADRVHVKSNFVIGEHPPRLGTGEYALYVGRLSPEKGLRTLLAAWAGAGSGAPLGLPLKLVGSGPMERELRELSRTSPAPVEFVGPRPRSEVMRVVANARFVVCPSECYDAMALAALEAFATGVPVIASRIGGFLESVQHGKTGLHVAPGDAADLMRAARWLSEDLATNVKMGAAAREAYVARYAPERNYEQLVQIYQAAQQRRGLRQRNGAGRSR